MKSKEIEMSELSEVYKAYGPLWHLHDPARSFARLQSVLSNPPEYVDVDAQVVPGEYRIKIHGVLLREDMLPWYISTSYVDIVRKAKSLMANGDRSARVVLDIDSPGGSTSGLSETFDALVELASVFRVEAHVSGMCCSAAYMLACAADEIVASDSSIVGSIGVYGVVYDSSKLHADMGIKVKVFSSGELKGATVAGNEVPEAFYDEVAGLVRTQAAEFFTLVSATRGIDRGDWQHGGVYLGAAAKSMGLVDKLDPRSMFPMNEDKSAIQALEAQVAELKAQVIAAKEEKVTALASAEKALQEAAEQSSALSEALQAQVSQRKADMLNAAVADGRVAPAQLDSMKQFAESSSPEALQSFLDGMSPAINSKPVGVTEAQPKASFPQADPLSAFIAAQCFPRGENGGVLKEHVELAMTPGVRFNLDGTVADFKGPIMPGEEA